ncbi:MAG: gliding motility-associated C-terminal domain-containing protein [Bacteroidetes bacterium]|nr:gliding motility-associated C-terminal domain-containing protein [Bacteroidota bacterium]
MRTIYRCSIHVILLSVFLINNSFSQCANNNVLWIDLTPPCPGSDYTSCIFGGEYVTVSVTSGYTYTFSTCGDTDFDTQITTYNQGTGVQVSYNDDGCGLQSTITWTATFTGVLRVLVDAYNCVDQSTCMTLTVSCSPSGCPSYNHPTVGLQNTYLGACMVSTCCANYYDDGGSGANYSNSINQIYRTFCPSQPGNCIRATITSMSIEPNGGGCYDWLSIINGPTQNNPVLWQGCDVIASPNTLSGSWTNPFTSTDASGCLGFRFYSDGTAPQAGWAISISCVACAGGPSATEDNNCSNANAVCNSVTPVTGASTGPGLTSECAGCVLAENYSNWYSIYISSNGSLSLTIDPVNNPDDYDFALWGPGVSCANINSTAPVRCSYAANNNNTGMSCGAGDNSEDVTGNGWVECLNVSAGQTYYLMVNNWSNSGSGFTIDWTGTAVLGSPPGSVVVQTNNTCPGLNNGSACAVVNAGLPPYNYSWNTGGMGSCIGSLAPGTYTVTVTDGSGCVSTVSGTVGNFGSPTPNASKTDAGCPGSCNGQISAAPTGGTGAYTYNWNNGCVTQICNSICAGTYTVTVSDANGCTGSQSVTVNNSSTNSSAPTGITAAPGTTVCSGTNVTLNQTGGSLGTGATYNWYTGSCGGTFIGSGASIVVTPGSTTQYWVRAQGTCNTTACASVTITVNTVSTAPSSITAAPGTTVCSGTNVTLTQQGGVLGSGAVYNWYTGSCGGTFIGSGNSIVVTPASTTTYYVRAQGTCNTTGCAQITITVNTSSTTAASATAAPNPTCGGATTLTANGGSLGSGANWQWYSGSCGGTFVGSGNNLVVSPASTTTYYVRAEGTCNTTSCVSVIVTVNSSSTAAASASAAPNPTCGGATTLTANGGSLGAGANWQWYSGSCGGAFVGSGNNLVVSPGATTTYYVRAEGSCNTTSCVSVTVTVNSSSTAAASASAAPNPTCGGATTLTANGGSLGTGANWQWYSGSCGGAFVGSGNNLVVSPASTTTYYVRAEGTCNTTSCVSVTVTVNSSSTAAASASAAPNPTCGGATTLTAIGGSLGAGANWQWYTGSCGGTFVGSGSPLVVSPASTTTYYVRAEGSCNTTSCVSITVTVNTSSTAPTGVNATSNPICAGNSTTLTVQGGSLGTGANWQWYTGSCGGTWVASGGSLNVSPGSTTTYYVRAEGSCNTTACASVTITVNSSSTDPTSASAAPNPVCSGNSTTLSVSGGSLGSGASWQWYSGSCGGAPVGSGASLVVSPVATTTYYVRAEGSCNTTSCVSVTVTVNAASTAPTGINATANPICVGNSTTLTVQGGSLGTGANWQWYTGSCGGTWVASGGSLVVSPASTTTYYVRAEGTCNTTACASLTVTVNTLSTAPASASAAPNPICSGNSTTLTVAGGSLGSGASWTWYSGGCGAVSGGIFAGSGSSISVSPAVTTSYFVRAEGPCNTTACVSVVVTVNSGSTAATSATAAPNPICAGNSSTLNIVGGSLGSGANWQWYSGSCGGTFVGTGVPLVVNPAGTTTYYVRAEGSCNTTSCVSVTVNVSTNSTAATSISATSNPICDGSSTTLNVVGGSLGTGANWQWYNSGCGTGFVGSGSSLAVSPSSTTTYYVRAEGTCNTTACVSLIVTVNSLSAAPTGATASVNPICQGNSTTLNVTGGSLGSGATWQWYSGSCGGAPIGSGASVVVTPASTAAASISATSNPICNGNSTTLTQVGGVLGTGANWQWYTGSCGGTNIGSGPAISISPSSTTTYYVRAEGTCNTTACVNITITVNSLSTDPASATASVNPICQGNSTTLSVNGGSLGSGATWQWYTGSCGGVGAGSGASLVVSPASTTTYYVRAEGACNSTNCVSITITVNTNSTAATSISASVNPTCPSQSTTLTEVGGSLGTGANWQWYSGSCGGTFIGSGPSVVVSPAVTTTYYVRAEGTCNTTACVSITVNVTNTLSADPTSITATVNPTCPSQSTTLSVVGGSLGTGGTWQWYTGSCGGVPAGSGLSLTVSPAVTTTYYVRGEGTCNTTACVSITINVTNTLSTDPASISATVNPICAGSSTSLSVNGGSLGTGAAWQWYTGSCGGTAAGSGSPLVVSPAATTTYYVRGEGTCNTTACVSLIITVNPVDDPSFFYASNSYCQTAPDPTPTITGTPGGTFSGPAQVVFISTATGQIDLSASTVGGPYVITYTTSGVCPASSTFNITITPAITDASFAYSDPFCQGGVNPTPTGAGVGAGTFTAIPAGLIFADANLGTIDLTASAPGTYDIKNLIPASGGCAADSAFQTITIDTAATVSAGSDATICEGGTYALSGSIGGSAASGTWSGGDGTFTPNATTLTATYTPGATDISMGSVTLTLTTDDPSGPCPAVSDAMTITINPAATVSAGTDATICAGDSYALSGSVGGGASSGSWTTSGDGTFTPDALTLTATYTPGINDNSMGTVTLTLTTNDPVGPCIQASDAMTITINPAATVGAGSDATICADGCHTLSGAVGGGAASGSWTTAGDGTFDNANLLTATYCPGPNDIIGGSVTLTLTTNDPAGPCPAVNDVMVLTINPIATVNAGADDAICQGATYTLNGIIGGSASSGTWTTSGDGLFNNAALPNATYTPGPNDISNGSVTLTFTTDDPDAGGPCTAVSDFLALTINSDATANAGSDATICAGTCYTLSGGVGGGASSGSWTSAGDGTFDNPNLLGATYCPGPNDLISGSVTLTLTTDDPAGPCVPATDDIIITVNQVATANAGSDATICAGDVYSLSGSIGGAASSLNWTTSGDGNFSNSTIPNPTYTPGPNDISSGTATLTITTDDPAGPCPSATDNMVLTINPAATVNAGTDGSACADSVYNLSGTIGGSATSATWTTLGDGTFGNANALNTTYAPGPSDISGGSVVITLTTNDPAGPCPAASDNLTLNITPLDNAGFSYSASTFCITGSDPAPIITGLPGGTFSGPPQVVIDPSTGIIDLSASTLGGPYTITYTTNGSCPNSSTFNISITTSPDATFSYSDPFCETDALNPVPAVVNGGIFTAAPAGLVFVSAITGEIDLAASTPGTYTVQNTIAAGGGCSADSATDVVTIDPAATVNAGSDAGICEVDTLNLTGGIGGSASSSSWSTSGDGTFGNASSLNTWYAPGTADITAGTVTLTLTTDDPAGVCTAVSDNLVLTITQQEDASFYYPSATVCQTGTNPLPVITGTPGGSFSGPPQVVFVSVATGEINVALSTLGGPYTITYTTSGTCSASSTFNISIVTGFNATFAYSDPFCQGGSATPTGAGVGQGTFSSTGGVVFTDIVNGTIDLSASTPGTWNVTNDIPASGGCAAASYTISVIIEQAASVNAGPDAEICDVIYAITGASISGSASSVTWSTSGDGTFDDPNIINPVYTAGVNDLAINTVTLTVITDDPAGVCQPDTDSFVLTLDDPATVSAGADDTICAGDTLLLSGSIGGSATTSAWTTSGDGTFGDALQLTTYYVPGAGDLSSGLVTFTLTTDDPAGPCPAVSDDLTLYINGPAIVYAGVDTAICGSGSYFISDASVSGSASSVTWTSSGDGTFDNISLTNPTYTPGINDMITGSVLLTITSDDPVGPCPAVSDAMTLSLDPLAIALAGSDDTVCAGDTVVLTGIIGGGATTGTWTTSGDGIFGNASQLNTWYLPGSADLASGLVIITLTTDDPAGPCTAASDNLTLTINGPAIVNAGPDASVCGTVFTFTGASFSGSTSSVTWTTSGDGSFTDPAVTNPTYNLGVSDMIAGTVALTITSDDPVGSCPAVSDQMVLSVDQLPIAFAGADNSICEGSTYQLTGSVAGSATSGLWSTTGDGSFDDPSLLNAVYTPGGGDIAAGTVILILTTDDPAGPCVSTADSLTLTINPAPTADAGSASALICSGSTYGLSASYGGSATSASWTTSGDGFFDDPTSTTAIYTPGSVDILAGSANLCFTTDDPPGACPAASDCILLNIDAMPVANAGADDTICAGTTVNLAGTIGGSATSVTWITSGDGTFNDPGIVNAVYSPGATDISLESVMLTMITDNPAGPCDSVSDFMLVSIIPQATIDAGPDQFLCGYDGYPVMLDAITGGSTDEVFWTTTGAGNFDNPTLINPVYSMDSIDVINGSVKNIVTGTDTVAGCMAADSMTVFISIAPNPSITAGDTIICDNETTTLTATGGTVFLWSTGATTSTITVGPDQTDTFTVKVTNGSCLPVEDTIIIYVLQSPDVEITTPEQTIIDGQTVQLNATGATTYSWIPDEYLDKPNKDNPVATPTDTTVFIVTGTDAVTGCSDMDTVQINVFGKAWIFVPNFFSPNKDGKNDKLNILGHGVTELSFIIYDRWGERLWELTDVTKINTDDGWNGTFKGKPLHSQVFVYHMMAKFSDESTMEEQGNVTMVR